MKQEELLRHVADNVEAGRSFGHGLLFLGRDSTSTKISSILFDRYRDYQLAPKTVVIGDKEVEKGITYLPDYSVPCYVVDLTADNYVVITRANTERCQRAVNRGLVFLSEDKAVDMAMALLDRLDAG